MSFIQQWITDLMQDPEERDMQEIRRVDMLYDQSKKVREHLHESTKPPNFWRLPGALEYFHLANKYNGRDGKQNRLLAEPNSRANSYESVLDIYAQCQQRWEAEANPSDD
uniref:Uncharacterized protein n=1 Tax=Mucochytrium quahogii TaxID=96639 RepID=A0A7S2WAL7_9STRA|mmetsp:Transcript_6664/g.10499  ORF Transcript_6664/g.10499 Transcript_6664/m.10499 type:complete len:110 (+) Transcript_6664:179-508(+)|eukprot:CAMPEP_0203746022 /NCGR_PEP_ID=MMETSP0098-20131031/1575_1 /ASSEMBLY_ACC=CAM_ASM_000208 /TAXON_ID=96639 /ORGANISM=" , Strain NY0313808BC1" /LENGTH=109 /DNA_ID=CAMNT_0050633977 /DNA_START=471 /DNA_END=800 /DNA_ORIENTATION=-